MSISQNKSNFNRVNTPSGVYSNPQSNARSNKQQNLHAHIHTEGGKKLLKRASITTARLIQRMSQGQYRSLFKSGGLEYAESRLYTFGDDARYIDWPVSSRMSTLHSKYFHDDTNRILWFMFDCSGSMQLGAPRSLYEIAMDVVLVFAQLALYQKNRVGGMVFSKDISGYVRPSAHYSMVDHFLSLMINNQYKNEISDFDKAVSFTHRILTKRTLVVICSDFLIDNFFALVSKLSKVHDVLLIKVKYNAHDLLPKHGVLKVSDAESDKQGIISLAQLRNQEREGQVDTNQNWKAITSIHNVYSVVLGTQDDVFDSLLRFLSNKQINAHR